jgi:uncharacterized protein (TIGR03000 family)
MEKSGVSMRYFKKFGFGLLVVAILGMPSSARAQYFFGGSASPWNYGSWGYGMGGYGMGNWGGYNGFGGLPPYGYGPGLGYASPYNAPYIPSYAPVVLPGFGATDPVRARSALYPAIPEPPADAIRSALASNEKDKARIDMQLPSAGAKVYLDGVLTKQTGVERMFITPKLNPGAKYVMNVEVVWQAADGQSRTIRRQVTIRAGETATLELRNGY